MKKALTLFFIACLLIQQTGSASPWAEGKNYSEKTGGKALFGVKNTLLGWTAIFTETIKYEYYLEKKKGWEGLCVGAAKAVLYTATGAIHFVTFPIPVDFPNMGEGVLHSSVKEQAEREQGKKLSPEEVAQQNAGLATEEPVTTPT